MTRVATLHFKLQLSRWELGIAWDVESRTRLPPFVTCQEGSVGKSVRTSMSNLNSGKIQRHMYVCTVSAAVWREIGGRKAANLYKHLLLALRRLL